MKIVFNYIQSGGVFWYLKGLMNAFASAGHEVHFIPETEQKTILDSLNLIESSGNKIDLFIGSAYPSFLNSALQKGILYRPYMKVVLYCEAHPDSEVGKIKPTRPDLVYDVANAQSLINIDSIANRIDLLFIHHHKNAAHGYLQGWENHVKQWSGIGMGCDIVQYRRGNHRDEFKCDASMISNYWEYKARRLRPWIFPLINKIDLKIWGGSPFPILNYLGSIPEDLASDIWASSTCNLQIHEPQCELGFECSERTFKVIGTGNFLISDYVKSLVNDYFSEDEIVTAKTPEEYHERILHFIKNQGERMPYIKKGQDRVLKEHTYHDRAAEIMSLLGFEKEVENILNTKSNIIKEKFENVY